MQNDSLVTMQHEMFVFTSTVHEYHVYQDVMEDIGWRKTC